jgi:hypothetical protein
MLQLKYSLFKPCKPLKVINQGLQKQRRMIIFISEFQILKAASMKKLLPVCLLVIFSLNSFCQHSQLSFSDDFKIAEKEYKNQTVTHSIYHNNSFYTATNSGIGGNYKWAFTKLYDLNFAITISKFDRSMNEIKKFELQNGEKVFGPLEPELFLLNNKLCLAYFQSDNNKSSFSLYLTLVDDNDLITKETKKICTIQQENVGIFKMESVVKSGLVYIAASSDNTKALIVCKASPNTVQAFVIDNNLNLIHQSKVHTAATEFNIPSAVLTNDGLECFVLKSKDETRAVCINPEGRKIETRLNASGNLSPYQTTASLSRDGKNIFICSTTTLSGDNDMNCNGLLLSQLDCNTLRLSKPLAYEFPPEVLEALSLKGGGGKHKKEYFIYNFTPNVMELDNGNIVVLGSPENESTSSSMKMSMDMNNNMQWRDVATSTLEVGPVIAFFPDKNGKTFEYAAIPRKINFSRSAQSGTGAIKLVQAPGISHSYASFIATAIGDEIVILYDDDENNVNKGDLEKLVTARTPGNLVLAEAEINSNKKLQYRKQIGENLKGHYTYFLGNVIPTSSSSIIFPVGKEGVNFNARKMFYSNWCFMDIK